MERECGGPRRAPEAADLALDVMLRLDDDRPVFPGIWHAYGPGRNGWFMSQCAGDMCRTSVLLLPKVYLAQQKLLRSCNKTICNSIKIYQVRNWSVTVLI